MSISSVVPGVQQVQVNGVRIAFQDTGKGEPLVLVHGSWGSHRNWDPVVPGLSARHRVVSYDRRGHSESERTLGQVALKFVLATPEIASTLPNIYGEEQIEEFAAAPDTPDLTADRAISHAGTAGRP